MYFYSLPHVATAVELICAQYYGCIIFLETKCNEVEIEKFNPTKSVCGALSKK